MDETFEDWMREGQEAFDANWLITDCPYPTYSEQAASWRRGYANAKWAESLNGTLPA